MNPYRRHNINKILIIVAIVLVVIAIVSVITIIILKNQKQEISYKDTITNKNYFSQITINLNTKEVKRDEEETTMTQEFDISEEKENLILSSREELINFFANSTYEVEFTEETAKITNKFQTKKIILETENVKYNFNAENVEEMQEGIYILSYDTQKRTKAAYEYLSTLNWIKKVEIDQVLLIETINDESQTVYGKETKEDAGEYKSHGVKAMGLDNYQNIIKDNGNPSEVTIATIGYGACIDNKYFEGKISENYYNFIQDSKDVHETIAQGSRILEVIKESTTDNIKIMPLVVINDEQYTTIASIIKAISYASKNADIICYEFINPENYMINLALSNAFKGNVPVCCVTKLAEKDEEIYPANNATTIAVSSIDKSSKTTSYSGSGEYLDFVAYSTDVKEIFNSDTSVSKWSGAHYSNAHIVSAIALIKTYNKDYTILEIYNILRNYCKDLGEKGKDSIYGYGCPDFSEIKISDIDKQAPKLEEVSFDNEKWEHKKSIKIKAEDNIKIYGWAVTTSDSDPKEWNKLEQNSNTLDVTTEVEKNGSYYVWVTDSAGNASYMNIEVNKIDNTAPKIQYAIDNSKQDTEKYVTINVTATDEESGLHETAYSWDKLAWGAESNTLKVTENGRHKIYVRDALENISEKEIIVKTFPQEGKADIGEGTIIKSIVVSSSWDGNKNNNVRITFSDNLSIAGWKITELNEIPQEFSEVENEIEPDTDTNTNTNTLTNNTVSQNTVANNNQTNTNINTSSNTNAVQGYANLTVTVSLKTGRTYYAWVKDSDGNILSQSFTISKVEI